LEGIGGNCENKGNLGEEARRVSPTAESPVIGLALMTDVIVLSEGETKTQSGVDCSPPATTYVRGGGERSWGRWGGLVRENTNVTGNSSTTNN